jgi:hypothetical protein
VDTKCIQCDCNYCSNIACPVYRETCVVCLAYDLAAIIECPQFKGARNAEDFNENKV